MIIQTVLRNHIKFLTNVHDNIEVIHAAVETNNEVAQYVSSGFHRLKAKDRKTVSSVLLSYLSNAIGYKEDTIVTLIEQLHYTSVVGTVSTTESDIHDLLYCIDIPKAIDRMKHQHAELMAM